MSIFFLILFIIFTLLEVYIVIQFARRKNHIFLREVFIIYLLFLCFLIAEYLFKFKVSDYILTLVVITLFCHTFIGNYLNMYNKSTHFDRYLHAFGSFSFALFAYSIIDQTIYHLASPKLYVCLYVIAIGITLGVIFEILEFCQDRRKKTNKQKGLIDTDFDLIANMIGSVIAGIFYVLL